MDRTSHDRFPLSSPAAFLIAGTLIVVSILLSALQYRAHSRSLMNEWEAKTAELAKVLALSVQPLLKPASYPALKRVLSQTVLTPETISVTVLDPSGVVLATSASSGIGLPFTLPAGILKQALGDGLQPISWIERKTTGRVRYALTPLHVPTAETPPRVQPAPSARIAGILLVGTDLSQLDRILNSNLLYLLFLNILTVLAVGVFVWTVARPGLPGFWPTSSLPPGSTAAEAPAVALAPLPVAEPGPPTAAEIRTEWREPRQGLTQAVLNSLTAHIALLDRDGTVMSINQAWDRFARENGILFPYTTDVGVNYLEQCRRASGEFADDAWAVLVGIQSVLDGSLTQFTHEYVRQLADHERWFQVCVTPLPPPEGGAVVSHVDITDRKRAERALLDAQANTDNIHTRLDTLYKTIPIGLLYLSQDLTIERASQQVADLHGRAVGELIGRKFPDLIPGDRWNRLKPICAQVLEDGKSCLGLEEELPDPLQPGSTRVILSDFYPDRSESGAIRGAHVVIQDITLQKRALHEQEQHLRELEAKNRELDQMAIRDPLTGLYNRRFFDEVLNREWGRFQRSGEAFTVLIMDVDNFKRINDHHGHDAGDQALQQVGMTLRVTLRETDLVARIGGDEFAALLLRTDAEHSAPVIEKLRQALRHMHVTTAVGPIGVSLSLGSATVPGFPPVSSAAELLRVADKRMYDAKRRASSRKGDAR
jgi:diguanylate cyclase (GGDEF)-like protein/PAS domain S-box-containing protein